MPRYLIERNCPVSVLTPANRFRSLIATALFGLLSSSFAALPAAADSFEPLQVTVKFGDLDVSHPTGAAVLYSRIRAAAAIVCSPLEGNALPLNMRRNACVKKATLDAVAKVNQPALAAVYGAKTKDTSSATLASLQNR
jgi:UrcA family protein